MNPEIKHADDKEAEKKQNMSFQCKTLQQMGRANEDYPRKFIDAHKYINNAVTMVQSKLQLKLWYFKEVTQFEKVVERFLSNEATL